MTTADGARETMRRMKATVDGMTNDREAALALKVVNLYAQLATVEYLKEIRDMLAQTNICDHGVRGFCVHCLKLEVQ